MRLLVEVISSTFLMINSNSRRSNERTVLYIQTIIIAAILFSRKQPLICFCIIFFFLNHLIEGTIIPLELFFEHRNYIPSMLFFVLISIPSLKIIDYFSYKKSIQYLFSALLIFCLAAQGHTTHLLNSIYKNDLSLWSDNVKKAKSLHRPRHNLGKALLVAGYYEEGLREMEKALNAKAGGRVSQKYMTHYNLGIYYLYFKKYDKAITHFNKSLDYYPNNPKVYNKFAVIMLDNKLYAQAVAYIKKAMRLDPDNDEYQRTLDLIIMNHKNNKPA